MNEKDTLEIFVSETFEVINKHDNLDFSKVFISIPIKSIYIEKLHLSSSIFFGRSPNKIINNNLSKKAIS